MAAILILAPFLKIGGSDPVQSFPSDHHTECEFGSAAVCHLLCSCFCQHLCWITFIHDQGRMYSKTELATKVQSRL